MLGDEVAFAGIAGQFELLRRGNATARELGRAVAILAARTGGRVVTGRAPG